VFSCHECGMQANALWVMIHSSVKVSIEYFLTYFNILFTYEYNNPKSQFAIEAKLDDH